MKISIILPLIALSAVSVAFARVGGAHDHHPSSFQFQEEVAAQAAQLVDPREITTATSSADEQKCSYTITVKTGDSASAGTCAIISLTLADGYGNKLQIEDLASLRRPGFHCFQPGTTVAFEVVNGTCLSPKPCKMLLESDNSGKDPSWYVEFVEVTEKFEPHSDPVTQKFKVNQWLAEDEYPYQLYAYRDYCSSKLLLPGVAAMA